MGVRMTPRYLYTSTTGNVWPPSVTGQARMFLPGPETITADFEDPTPNSNRNLWPKLPLHPERSASPVRTQLPQPSRQRRAGHRTSYHNLETTSHLWRTRGLHGRMRQREDQQKRRQHPVLSNVSVVQRLRQECTQLHLGLRVTEEMGKESPQLPCDSWRRTRVTSTHDVSNAFLVATCLWVENRVCKTSMKEPTMASVPHLKPP